MKKILCSVLMAVMTLSLCLISPSPVLAGVGRDKHEITDLTGTAGFPAPPEVNSGSAFLIELNSGSILYDRNGRDKVYPASTTKIMTAYLALKNLDLKKECTFSNSAIFDLETGGHHFEFQEGEVLTVDEMLQFLMVESVNECAYAFAEEISGGISAFADLMNQTALEMGAENTHFCNPHGLNDPNHYTTARDMAMILWGCIQDDRFQQYSSIRGITINGRKIRTEGFSTYYNHHEMLFPNNSYYDADVICGKTGYTSIAGNTLVTYARRGNMDLICIIMKGEDKGRFAETKALLDWAFGSFEVISVQDAEKELAGTLGLPAGLPTEAVGNDCILVPSGKKEEHITSTFTSGFDGADPNVIGTRTWLYDGAKVAEGQVRLTDAAVEAMEKNKAERAAWQAAEEEARKARFGMREKIVIGIFGLVFLVLLIIFVRMVRANLKRKRAARKREQLRRERLAQEEREQR